MSLSLGTRLGPYQVTAQIGAGGMGDVYKARDTRLDRSVAIKVLPSDVSADPERRARFDREAKAIAGLSHPHICTLYDVGEHDGATFLVMEHLTGETLAQRLEKGPLPLDQALTVAAEIADALSAAHRQGVIHRDLKPGNVMLTKAGAKLLDFGLAKLKGHGELAAAAHLMSAPTQSTPLTVQGVILGTVQYMAPEQLEGKPADARTDLWALGAIIYEMVAGRRAFEGTTAAGLIGAILEREPVPLATRQPLTPSTVDRLVRRCLTKDPDDRWQSAHDVADELRWMQEASHADTAWGTAPGRRRRLVLALAIPLTAVAVAALYVLPAFKHEHAIRSITVLPVKDLAAESPDAVLAEAVLLALNTQLGQLGRIEVKGYWSARLDRSQEKSDGEIARDLGVDAFLRATLVRDRDNVQVHAQLFDPGGRIVWAQQYEYATRSISELSSRVARDVAAGIELRLTREEERRLTTAPTVDPAAFQAYALGHYYWTKRGEGLRIGLGHFQRAITLDPGFADAQAGLADSYNLLGFYNLMLPAQAYPLGRAAAEHALRLDAQNARAHTALGAIHAWYDFDNEASLREFQAAIKSNPQYWLAYAWRCPILQMLGRSEEAIASGMRAIDGDRNYPILHMAFGWRDYVAGDFEQAEQRFRKILELTPESSVGRRLVAQALCEMGSYREAEGELRLAIQDPAHSTSVDAHLAYVLAKTGRRDEAEAIVSDLTRRFENQAAGEDSRVYVSALDIAIGHAGLGWTESAVDWLNRAFEQRASELFLLPGEPRFKSLRSSPRFHEMLKRLGTAGSSR